MARKNRILSEKELEELMMNDESDFSEDSSDESGTSSEEETIVCNSNSQKSDSTSKSNSQTYIGSTPTVSDNIASTIEIGGHNVEVSNAADTEVYLDPVFLDDLDISGIQYLTPLVDPACSDSIFTFDAPHHSSPEQTNAARITNAGLLTPVINVPATSTATPGSPTQVPTQTPGNNKRKKKDTAQRPSIPKKKKKENPVISKITQDWKYTNCYLYKPNVFPFTENPGIRDPELLDPNKTEFDFFAHSVDETLVDHLVYETNRIIRKFWLNIQLIYSWKNMIPIPRLRTTLFGFSLRTGTLIILYTVLIISFFGLVIMTSSHLEDKPQNRADTELDIRYILNMVASVCGFLATPLALYGVHHSRANFLVPFIAVHTFESVALVMNTIIELIAVLENVAGSSMQLVIVLFLTTVLFVYSILILFSYYTELKEQREEIK